MPISVLIKNPKRGDKVETFKQDTRPEGLVVYNEPLRIIESELEPFVNPEVGNALNQNVTFGGTPELIHDGGDTSAWAASAITGVWDFTSTTDPNSGSACIEKVDTSDGDEALFEDPTSTDMSGRTALTGFIRLEKYNSIQDEVQFQFSLNGINVGNSINIDDFISIGALNVYQKFVIDKSNFGITNETVDELRIMTVAKPQFRLDDIQIEETGSALVYTVTLDKKSIFYVDELVFSLADNIPSTLQNGTMPNIAFDALLGVSQLATGVIFQRIQRGEVNFAIALRDVGSFLSFGGTLSNSISDGTNTYINLRVAFDKAPLILDGRREDSLSLTVNDDLSGLLEFTAIARGGLERVP